MRSAARIRPALGTFQDSYESKGYVFGAHAGFILCKERLGTKVVVI
ncbi:MAG TPA: hypothetical protein VGV62_14275 [Xanthobacteraceae bacterium]|jgi:hypothetical protein|nr:hypothetical protein [Xanthobacteraceae bacterium]